MVDEREADALESALDVVVSSGAVLIASSLARVEVSRALRTRLDSEPGEARPWVIARAAREALVGIAIAPMTTGILEHARIIGSPALRTLDAIHLATAVSVGADEVWTYDSRMLTVSEELGILARAPGAGRP